MKKIRKFELLNVGGDVLVAVADKKKFIVSDVPCSQAHFYNLFEKFNKVGYMVREYDKDHFVYNLTAKGKAVAVALKKLKL